MFRPLLWALRFYRRHLPVVLALSLVPAAERFAGQLTDRPPAIGLASEALTLAARVGLIAFVVVVGLQRDPAIGGLSGAEHRRRGRHALRTRRRGLLVQGALLGAAFVLADLVPERLVPALVEIGPLYWAVLLAVKNLTVIPLTMLWCVGVYRWLLEEPADARARRR